MREITYSQAIQEAMREEMARDPDVFIMGEDIAIHGGAFGVTRGMWKDMPDRVLNTPISEAAIAGAAIGAALVGCRPIAELMYIDFSSIAMDQLVNQGAKIRYMFGGKARVPMVLRTQGGSGRGNAAQHSQSLEAWFTHIPGLKVVMSSTPYDAKGLLKSAIRDDNLVIFIEHKTLYWNKGPVPEEEYTIPLGAAEVKRRGRDATVVAWSAMVPRALKAAETLSQRGIEVEVIDPRTLVPLDEGTIIESVKKTGRLVVVHEACKRGGYGGEIASMIAESEAFDYLDAPIQRVAGDDVPIPYNQRLEKYVVPDEEKIIAAVERVV